MQPFDETAEHLQPYYSRFDVANRLLFTGHSHQAWPDAAFSGMDEYMRTAADYADGKWSKAFEKTEILRSYLRGFYDDPGGKYCREQNTHVLTVSWLSALDLKRKPKIITTSGEFHSMYRQLRRLQEEGLEIVYLPHRDDETLLRCVQHHLDERTAAVMLSRVYFETSEINTKLPEIAAETKKAGIPLLIDDYHGTNVVPLSIRDAGLDHCYFLIGGYKYLQWGEGNCFLRYPSGCGLRPAVTGWFAAFRTLDHPRDEQPVRFDDGQQKFAGATYDPVSQFRAAAVAKFFREQGLTAEILRRQYSAQVGYLRLLFDEAGFDETLIHPANTRPVDETGGFLALQTPHARRLQAELHKQGIYTDARGSILRIGPAPYTTSGQCRKMMSTLGSCLKKI